MASKRGKEDKGNSLISFGVVAKNRKARHLYEVEDEVEAGLQLTGTEVKSLRSGRANIQESYAEIRNEEGWLVNAHIPEFSHGNRENHDPRRPRKLLLHKREISRLMGMTQQKGMTLVPLRIFFNRRGIAKVLVGVARGKTKQDKRETIKERDWQREKARLMKDYR
ncbi:SsrA-binding protein SmpB [Yunchengibacter salinarum]|uniref:SsrA-binding protein SmpB n=1 Tax=Yunchengibacter salinarum TaxID=3133399 RepID=UPI0035B67029